MAGPLPGNPLRAQTLRRPSVSAMADLYRLHLLLPHPARLTIGRLGTFLFPAGHYLYIGSAQGRLVARVARHLRPSRRAHWHIDHLLQVARVEGVVLFPDAPWSECQLAASTAQWPGAHRWPLGFGSSDCRCEGHLVWWGENPGLGGSFTLPITSAGAIPGKRR